MYGAKHWQHEPDVETLLFRAQQTKAQEPREATRDPQAFSASTDLETAKWQFLSCQHSGDLGNHC